MDDEPEEPPSFPEPVRFPFAGTMAQARAAVAALGPGPAAPGIGATVVTGEAPGSSTRLVGAGLADRLAALPQPVESALRQPVDSVEACSRDLAEERKRRAADKRLLDRRRRGGDTPAVDDDNGDDNLPPPPAPVPPPTRIRRPQPKIFVDAYIQDALVPCVQRACGMPSSESVRSRLLPVTAHVVGDPSSSSRAIVLRTGTNKRDAAIMWVSRRGGLLCSCFAGTQNALFLSTSSRSMDCHHMRALRTALDTAGVDIERFRSRMRLRADAAPFTRSVTYGSTVLWIVLYRAVYSLVSFTAGNAASCIAPACRRFKALFEHVLAARAHCKLQGIKGSGEPPSTAGGPQDGKKASTAGARARFLQNEEEDEGVEKLPLRTTRGAHETDLSKVSNRLARNMLPCHVEEHDGEVWPRTADWQNLYGPSENGGNAENVEMLGHVLASAIRRGLLRDVNETLVESVCGSCGKKRGREHKITKEPALLCTHHPTAPSLKVCSATWFLLFSCIRIGFRVQVVVRELTCASLHFPWDLTFSCDFDSVSLPSECR